MILSDDLKQNIINDYSSDIQTITNLSKKYHVSKPTISKILKENNIPIYSNLQIISKGLNEDVFNNINTEEKAYFLGLFLADGCVYYTKTAPRIILGLKKQDSYMIEAFHSFLNAQTSLIYDNRGSGFVTCSVSSYKIADDLKLYDIDKPKCVRTLPILEIELMRHLLRGFFDGDGCLTYRLSHPERKFCNSYRGKIALITYEILKHDITLLLNYIGINNYIIERCNSDVFLEMIDVCRKDEIKLFYDFIYKNSHIYLKRKKEKFEQYFYLNGMI